MTLAGVLTDWTDIDVAAHELARCLGVLPEQSLMRDAKWVHWSNNALGNELVVLLDRLATLGFLEKRNEPDYQYRVAPQFRSRFRIDDIWKQFEEVSPVGLKLVVLRCKDISASRQFYEALGVVFTPEQHGSGPHHYSASLGETIVELYPSSEPIAPIRLGIGVSNVQTAVTAARGLSDCVVRFEPDSVPPSALLRDPDGNKVELT